MTGRFLREAGNYMFHPVAWQIHQPARKVNGPPESLPRGYSLANLAGTARSSLAPVDAAATKCPKLVKSLLLFNLKALSQRLFTILS